MTIRSIFYLVFFLLGLSLVPMPKTIQSDIPDPAIFQRLVPKVDPRQVACMAKNIYYEAGSESILGQAAVARVVLNRIRHGFAKTPCGVVYQETDHDGERMCQFSWVCADVPPISQTSPAYRQAEQIAKDVLSKDAYRDVLPDTALFFHSVLITPGWTYQEIKRIGNHLFYSRAAKPKPLDSTSEE